MTEPLIHIAGIYSPFKGQYCIVCSLELSSSRRGQAWEVGQKPPSGWASGAHVLKDGNLSCIVEADDETTTVSPGRYCTRKDRAYVCGMIYFENSGPEKEFKCGAKMPLDREGWAARLLHHYVVYVCFKHNNVGKPTDKPLEWWLEP